MTKQRYLSRQQIQQAKDLGTEEVLIPEWGGSVVVKQLNADERMTLQEAVTYVEDGVTKSDQRKMMIGLVIVCTVDEKGDPLFSQDDAAWLQTKNANAVLRIFNVASRINGMGTEEVAAITENFTEATSDDSPSASR